MPLKTIRDEEPTLNLTSMIDVLFLLIIFFMTAAKFTEVERTIDLKVPQVSTPGTLSSAPEPKIVNVDRAGQISFGAKPVSLDELTGMLASAHRQYRDVAVLIRGDEAATHGRMAQVYNACKRAGIGDLAISVKPETKTR